MTAVIAFGHIVLAAGSKAGSASRTSRCGRNHETNDAWQPSIRSDVEMVPGRCPGSARLLFVELRRTAAVDDLWDLVREWHRRASEVEALSAASADARAELLAEMAEVYTECAEELSSALRDRTGSEGARGLRGSEGDG